MESELPKMCKKQHLKKKKALWADAGLTAPCRAVSVYERYGWLCVHPPYQQHTADIKIQHQRMTQWYNKYKSILCLCVGWTLERFDCLKGNIRPLMKRASWKRYILAASTVTGVNSTVIVLVGKNFLTPPQSLLDYVLLEQMTSFWKDYPKAGSNL